MTEIVIGPNDLYDFDRAVTDPAYSLAWSKKFYGDAVSVLLSLVNDHVSANLVGASSFVNMATTQVGRIKTALEAIQTDLGRVVKADNSDWL